MVECRFLDGNPDTVCVVVIHQQLNQLSPSGLIEIQTQMLTRVGDSSSRLFEEISFDKHTVAVIFWNRSANGGLAT